MPTVVRPPKQLLPQDTSISTEQDMVHYKSSEIVFELNLTILHN